MPAKIPARLPEDPIDALVDHVCDQLVLPLESEPGSLGRSVFARNLREAILNPILSDEERAVVDGISTKSRPGDIDRLLTLRVKRALEHACQATGLSRSDLANRFAQSVIVARGDGVRVVDTQQDDGLSMFTMTQSISEESMSVEGEPHVFTNRGGRIEIEQTFDAAVKDKSSAPAGDPSVLAGEAGLSGETGEGPKPVAYFEMTEALEALEEHVLDAAPEEAKVKLDGLARGGDLIDKTLNGKYLITGRLGKGGFGTVYQAIDLGFAEELGESSGARVAIKVLNSNIQGSKKAIRSFLQEANRLTLLEHPNIVRWITFDKTAEGVHYFVMEFLEGRELDDILKEEKQLHPMRVGKILLDVLSALQCAHEIPDGRALLHLDLKPQNIFMLGAAERGAEMAKVIDFGIGQNVSNEFADIGQTVVDEDAQDEEMLEKTIFPVARSRGAEDSDSTSRTRGRKKSSRDKSVSSTDPARSESGTNSRPDGATRDGVVRRAKGGTVLYSSPEQCKHLRKDHDIVNLDARSDIYSLGVVGFKSLTGTYPFAKKAVSLKEAYRQHLMEPPRKVRSVRPKVPRRLAAVVDKCLEKDRERRFQTAQEAHEALERAMQPLVSKSFLIGAPIMLLPLIGLLAWTFFKAPVYREINTVEVERTAAGRDSETEPLRALYLATDNGGWQAALDFQGGETPAGEPVLMRGDPRRPESIQPLEEVVLKGDEQGMYRFHVVSEDPIAATDVFIRWPDAVTETPAFKLTTLAALGKPTAQYVLRARGDAAPVPLPSEDRAIWSQTMSSIQVKVFADGRVDRVGIRNQGAETEFSLLPSGSEDFQAAVLPSAIPKGDGRGISDPRTLEVVLEDLAGRTVLAADVLELRLTDQPTRIEVESLRLFRAGSPRWSSLPPYRLAAGNNQQEILITDGMDRMELRGSLTEASRGRKVTLELKLGSGASKLLTIDDGVDFTFEVKPSDLPGSSPDGSFASLTSSSILATLTILDAGLLPKDEGAGQPWTRLLQFKRLGQDLELYLASERFERQRLIPDGEAFAPGGELRLEIGTAQPGIVFGLYSMEPSDSTQVDQLVGAVSGTAAPGDRRIPFNADDGGTFVLRRFEASLVPDPVSGAFDALALSSTYLEERLRQMDVTAAIAETRFTVRSVKDVGVESAGFSSPVSIVLRDAKVGAKDLLPIEIKLTDPESLSQVGVLLERNGLEMSNATYSAEVLEGARAADVWVVAPERWARSALQERSTWPDGEYTVTLTLTDKAKNENRLDDVATFSVAADDPRMDLSEPESPAMTKVSVNAVITDGNGIAWPPVAWVEVGSDRVAMRLVDPERPNGDGPVLEANCRFEASLERGWSRKVATVHVSAAKASDASRKSEKSKEFQLTRVRPDYPVILEPGTLESGDSLRGGAMKLIWGPSSTDGYVFAEGGAKPSSELWAKLEATGVPYLSEAERGAYMGYLRAVNFFPTDKPMVIPSDDLRDYYLDETEVTQADFLEFVQAEDGYSNPQHWPFLGSEWEGAKARWMKERKGKWISSLNLEQRPEVMPVTGVLCEEALAFAAWAGKRLPTLLEWEYAVRGEKGRVFAARQYPVGDGELAMVRDELYRSDEGIYHLGGNVAEWTQTPYWDSLAKRRFERTNADFCSQHVNGGITMETLLGLFRDERRDIYGADGPVFFVAGAGWAPDSRQLQGYKLSTPPQDYRVVWRLELGDAWLRTPTASRVGFRCAKSAP